jgi:hypothetical protein
MKVKITVACCFIPQLVRGWPKRVHLTMLNLFFFCCHDALCVFMQSKDVWRSIAEEDEKEVCEVKRKKQFHGIP